MAEKQQAKAAPLTLKEMKSEIEALWEGVKQLREKIDYTDAGLVESDSHTRTLTAALEHSLNGLRKDVAAVQVSDIRIEQLSKQCEAAESRADLSLLAASVLGIVAIVLACVL